MIPNAPVAAYGCCAAAVGCCSLTGSWLMFRTRVQSRSRPLDRIRLSQTPRLASTPQSSGMETRREAMPQPAVSLLDTVLRAAATALIGAGAALVSIAGARAQTEPLVIARQGYFFVGGAIDSSRDGSPTVGHMYVEFQVPQKVAHPYPVVMIHGGSQTGTNFTGTPDGREGWAQYFLRRGYTVYVVDQVARGRAAQWSQANGPVTAANRARLEQRFVAPERFNQWPQARLHTQWPGAGKPGDRSFDQFYASQFPSLVDFPLQQSLNRDAAVALLDRIGPAVVLIHSQSGAFVWPIADKRPNLVKAIVAVEPNGPPAHDVEFKGAPEWFADAG